MNIWTHLIGSVLFVFLLYLTFAIPISPHFGKTKVVGIQELVQEEINEMVANHYFCALRHFLSLWKHHIS